MSIHKKGAPVATEIETQNLLRHRRLFLVAMDFPIELPSIYSFPPLFTRQPNTQTYTAQKAAWTKLILGYYRSKRLWRIDVNQETIEKVPIFSNIDIQRRSLMELN